MENKYKKAKIYTIRTHYTHKYFIGSTVQSLSSRFHEHKKKYADWKADPDIKPSDDKSYLILRCDDAYIELLEEYPCKNKDELKKREQELIREMKAVVVNVSEFKKIDNYARRWARKKRAEQSHEVVCECGSKYKAYSATLHKKTARHMNHIKSTISNSANELITKH